MIEHGAKDEKVENEGQNQHDNTDANAKQIGAPPIGVDESVTAEPNPNASGNASENQNNRPGRPFWPRCHRWTWNQILTLILSILLVAVGGLQVAILCKQAGIAKTQNEITTGQLAEMKTQSTAMVKSVAEMKDQSAVARGQLTEMGKQNDNIVKQIELGKCQLAEAVKANNTAAEAATAAQQSADAATTSAELAEGANKTSASIAATADHTLKLAKGTAKVQLRAYLSVVGAEVRYTQRSAEATIQLENTGNTFAHTVEAKAAMQCDFIDPRLGPQPPFADPIPTRQPAATSIGPKGKVIIPIEVDISDLLGIVSQSFCKRQQ